jgi:hypothetical protein
MATQTIEFRAPTAQAVTAKLFAIGSDTQVASASATEATNRKGTYAAAFTDVAAGTYDLIAFVSITPVARWFVKLTLTTATFQATDTATVESAISALQGADGDTLETLSDQIDGIDGGGGGDATLAKQTEILAAIQGSAVIQVASPNVLGNLVLTQGDDYDGVANPRAQWTVTTDYTSGWTVRLTIRDSADAAVYTNTGSVVSATVVAVTIAAPIGLTMTGCPGQWQGKFDVELTHSSGKKKTIAIGTCYINEDQTR